MTKKIKTQMADLDKIMTWFEGDEFDLEQAIAKYQQAQAIVKNINKQLDEVKNQIKELN